MSLFTNRCRGTGEITKGGARAIVVDAERGFVALYQTHAKNAPLSVANYSVNGTTGVLSTSNGLTAIPSVSDCVILPQSSELFDSVKTAFANIDSVELTLCSVCVGNGVTLFDMSGACSSCNANAVSISNLKAQVPV